MFVGVGLSGLMNLELALFILILYLMLTVNVSINAHLKKEFRLTYARLGPTEFRIIMIAVNTLFATVPALSTFSHVISVSGHDFVFKALDYVAVVILAALTVIYFASVISDAKGYAKIDPPHRD
jgi:hypothetical protein